MATVDDKENVAPLISSDPLHRKDSSLSPRRNTRKGRSKSIGPGSLDEPELPKPSAKDRRKSAFIPATKSILSKNEESERAARRKSMMNRRVSFAPEATLHTWDIIVDAKDHTTSTDSADSTRRASGFSGSSSSPGPSSDPSQDDEDAELLASPAGQEKRKTRRSSGIPSMNFNNPDDLSSSGVSGSEDESGTEEEEMGDSGDETDTAMSLDVDEATMQSLAGSDNSTGSSERLERALQQAAHLAGTRGIEYDEFGDMGGESVNDENSDASKPWAQRLPNSIPSLDQENINPFSPAFKADMIHRPATIEEEDEEDMSMDVTHAVGGILNNRSAEMESSPMSDGTMDLTQAVGKITGQKRRRPTTESGSPGTAPPGMRPKRRRSSAARSSMGDDTMDLTLAVGGIQSTGSPVKSERRRSLRSRRSSGAISEHEDATMEFTRVVGGIKSADSANDDTLDGNEDLSMELTTVLGGIKNRQQPALVNVARPMTPQTSESPKQSAANTTPTAQERFKDHPDLSAKKLLTPILQSNTEMSSKTPPSKGKGRLSISPAKLSNLISASPSRPQDTTPIRQSDSSNATAAPSPTKDVSYPDLPPLESKHSPVKTPVSTPRQRDQGTPHSGLRGQPDVNLQSLNQSPMVAKQQRTSPTKSAAVTPTLDMAEESRKLVSSMKLLTTPRKEALKISPSRKSVKHVSPVKAITPKGRPTPRGKEAPKAPASPLQKLREDIQKYQDESREIEKISLQDFLSKAGIRFMDLTTTKRRMTTAATPSKDRNSQADDAEINLESSVVAAACTVPELELYQHACHELKRYTKEGKQMISELEATTMKEQPPLIQAYMYAAPDRKLSLDSQMRDMKTEARLRSKEMWYGWRSQLLDELMTGLSKIGEGMIKDNEILVQAEEILDQVLPDLAEKHANLRLEADQLEQSVNAIPEEEKAELDSTRLQLKQTNDELAEKRRQLLTLRRQVEEEDAAAEHLRDSKEEFNAAIQESNRVREACRGVSLHEIASLKDSVKHLEEIFGWSITSASSAPSTITMTYKSELQLFFQPNSFQRAGSSIDGPNAPIRLSYVLEEKKSLTTTLRFFLQLLRASLQALRQCTTKISDLLALVSSGWETATAISESERQLNLETLTDARIMSDEQLAITATILLPKVKTKVRASFELTASVSEDLQISCSVQPSVVVVYGEQYNEKNMSEYLRSLSGGGFECWSSALVQMREKLIARGPKGARK